MNLLEKNDMVQSDVKPVPRLDSVEGLLALLREQWCLHGKYKNSLPKLKAAQHFFANFFGERLEPGTGIEVLDVNYDPANDFAWMTVQIEDGRTMEALPEAIRALLVETLPALKALFAAQYAGIIPYTGKEVIGDDYF